MTDQNAKTLKPWRHTVATHADRGITFDGPLAVKLLFILPKPKRPRWDYPAVKPDIDKYTRALLDGLTDGGLIEDDARVVDLNVMKRYQDTALPFWANTGVYVEVEEIA